MKASLAWVVREQQTSDIEQSGPFVGINYVFTIDETVNITVHKKLIIFVKDGSPRTLFLGNYTVTSGTAECVFNKVQVFHVQEE